MIGCLIVWSAVHDLDGVLAAAAPRAFEVLERLVAEPSTIGHESGAQEVLARELASAGFDITRLEIPSEIGSDPSAGVPRASYAGRYDLIGERRSSAGGRTLVINGHMDVVPADDTSRWTNPPFEPTRVDGWLVGRGAGDMKGGFVAGLLAIWALDEIDPSWLTGDLAFVSVIEEEATGNGTLAAGRAGYLGDAALLLEPTDLNVLLGGISLIWVQIEIEGRAGHAEAALDSVNPISAVFPIIEALEGLERDMNEEHADGAVRDEAFAAIEHPYNVNIGTVNAGDWASSVPSVARLEVRVGHPRHWSSEQAFEQVRAAVSTATAQSEWLRDHPPVLTMSGYRAERYLQDPQGEIVTTLADAHNEVHGAPPELVTIGSTTDARFYLNQFGMPAVAYGPRTRNMHGTDEAVELSSIVDCSRTIARFLQRWYGGSARS
jgi:acetylornithine deacetylase